MVIDTADDSFALPDMDEFAVDYQLNGTQELPDIGELCREFFSPGGTLSQAGSVNASPCEERPQQLEMSLAVARALQNSGNLCIEAPTGVGKSFAYSVPLIAYAINSRRPVLISTETINLQHQLIEKDLPFLRQLTGMEFRVALAKGRNNYLCRRRLALLSGEQRDMLLPVPQMALEAERVISDLENGRDDNYLNGIRDNSRIWHMVCSESGNCAGPKCEFYRNCYYFKARRKWDEADIVVANHALFLTDLAIRMEDSESASLLPDYGAVMIDEAHTLENNAAMHLGLHLSKSAMLSTVNRLYHPERAKGLFMRPGSDMLELRGLAQRAREEIYGFFAPYQTLLDKSENNSVRLNENQPDELPEELIRILNSLAEKIFALVENNEADESFRTELSANADRCRNFADMLTAFTRRMLPEAVYFLENEQDSVTCFAAPLNVAELLGKLLFNGNLPVLLCSATMTVADKFDYFTGRTGFTGGEVIRLDSPFSPEQAKLLIKRDIPEPASPDHLVQLTAAIRDLVVENNGSAFVLFTSYQSMKYCQEHLQDIFSVKNLPLLVQGDNLTRNEMLRRFREVPHSVLFGTDSFWTGVDVPGENLSMVIITRLPFASIGSPLTSARMEKIEASGKSSFAHYSLPEAVLKFRQGAGRLIRTKLDRGSVVVLDSRIASRRYGREFINSLPYKCEYI